MQDEFDNEVLDVVDDDIDTMQDFVGIFLGTMREKVDALRKWTPWRSWAW